MLLAAEIVVDSVCPKATTAEAVTGEEPVEVVPSQIRQAPLCPTMTLTYLDRCE
jgi:hypothetical protein